MSNGDMIEVSPTRSELLNLKKRVGLTKKGHSLLKKKQDVLVNEFFARLSDYKKLKQDIAEKTRKTFKALSLDIAYSGLFRIRSVSYASNECFDIKHSTKNIMGLKLPEIEAIKKDVESNTYENSPLLAKATRNFQELFESLINLASMEMIVYSLAEEIKKVKRRTNSLEHIQIPKVERTKDYVAFVLEEQERENFSRLKTIKNRLAKEA